MMQKPHVLLIIGLVAGFIPVLYGTNASAGEFPLTEKLEQCQNAYKLAHSKDTPQVQAAEAKLKHIALMRDILIHLNKKNANAQNLSDKEVLDNIRVMGHLMEMLVVNHLPDSNEEWYLY